MRNNKTARDQVQGRAASNQPEGVSSQNYQPSVFNKQISATGNHDKWSVGSTPYREVDADDKWNAQGDKKYREGHKDTKDNPDKKESIDKFDTVDDSNHENTVKVLNAIYENALMGKESCDLVSEYAEGDLAQSLKKQTIRYEEFIRAAQVQGNTFGLTLEDKTKGSRSMAKMSMKLKMMTDKSSTAIAKMVILGATNGVIDLGRIIRHTTDVSSDAGTLARELLDYEEKTADEMKYYL